MNTSDSILKSIVPALVVAWDTAPDQRTARQHLPDGDHPADFYPDDRRAFYLLTFAKLKITVLENICILAGTMPRANKPTCPKLRARQRYVFYCRH